MPRDIFRPFQEPARTIYDAFQKEASNRKGRAVADWIRAERLAVWIAARDHAQQHGLRVPTLDDVIQAERQANGHVDYGAKWAYGVVRKMQEASDAP